MSERTARSSVTFLHPFALEGIDEMQPPGTYEVETTEETIDSLSFLAYRRISTTIALPAVGTHHRSRQIVIIDPTDLAAAQARDASLGDAPGILADGSPSHEPPGKEDTITMHNEERLIVAEKWSWRTLAPWLVPPLFIPVAFILMLAGYVVFH